MRYGITDTKTGKLIATYGSLARAYRRADDLDRAYGAVRYAVSRVNAPRVPGQAVTIDAICAA